MSSRAIGGQSHDIFVVNLDGTGRTRLTDQQADYMGPRWSRDGGRIAFVKGRAGNSSHEIFLMAPRN